MARNVGRRRVSAQLSEKLLQHGVATHLDLAAQAIEQVRSPLLEVGNTRRQSLRMQAEPQHVDGRLEQFGCRTGDQWPDRRIGGNQRPMAVNGERRVRLVAGQDEVDRLARVVQRRLAERPLGESRGMTGRDQENIAFAQRHVEPFGQAEHHVAKESNGRFR